MRMSYSMVFFFFFQAEDGIRDGTVTGVQTCALPISLGYRHDKAAWREWFPADFITEAFPGQYRNWFYSMLAMSTVLENRSEERRVGKECRSRGEACQ